MSKRLKQLGIVLVVIGVVFVIAGGVAFSMTRDGYHSLESFSEAQNVTLSYNEDGELTDRGTTEGADAIMVFLTEDWGYPVDDGEMDPNDPLVNTASEYMFQMATVNFHILHGTQTVVLDEDVEYNGEVFAAGTYEVPVDGKYWADFDRRHPLEGPARAQAWSGTAHGIVGELGVGAVTHSTLKLSTGLSAVVAGIGLTFIFTGGWLYWSMSEGKKEEEEVAAA